MKRVVITGMGGVSAFGSQWDDIEAALKRGQNAVRRVPEWDYFQSLHTRLAAPLPGFVTPEGPGLEVCGARERTGAGRCRPARRTVY
jgi:3-oxoacyl-(acyl-carrier-protein) synthase